MMTTLTTLTTFKHVTQRQESRQLTQEFAATHWCGEMCLAGGIMMTGELRHMASDVGVAPWSVSIHGILGPEDLETTSAQISQTKFSTAISHVENTYRSTWTITLKSSVTKIIHSFIPI